MSNQNRPDQQHGKTNQPGGQDRQRHEQDRQHHEQSRSTEQGKKPGQPGQWNNPKATQQSTDTDINSPNSPTKQR